MEVRNIIQPIYKGTKNKTPENDEFNKLFDFIKVSDYEGIIKKLNDLNNSNKHNFYTKNNSLCFAVLENETPNERFFEYQRLYLIKQIKIKSLKEDIYMIKNENKQTLLHVACIKNYRYIIESLLSEIKEKQPNAIFDIDKNNKTCAEYFIESNTYDCHEQNDFFNEYNAIIKNSKPVEFDKELQITSMLELIKYTKPIKNEITGFIKNIVSNKKGFNTHQFYYFYEKTNNELMKIRTSEKNKKKIEAKEIIVYTEALQNLKNLYNDFLLNNILTDDEINKKIEENTVKIDNSRNKIIKKLKDNKDLISSFEDIKIKFFNAPVAMEYIKKAILLSIDATFIDWLKKTYDFDCLKLYEKCVKSMVDKDYVFKNFDEEMNNYNNEAAQQIGNANFTYGYKKLIEFDLDYYKENIKGELITVLKELYELYELYEKSFNEFNDGKEDDSFNLIPNVNIYDLESINEDVNRINRNENDIELLKTIITKYENNTPDNIKDKLKNIKNKILLGKTFLYLKTDNVDIAINIITQSNYFVNLENNNNILGFLPYFISMWKKEIKNNNIHPYEAEIFFKQICYKLKGQGVKNGNYILIKYPQMGGEITQHELINKIFNSNIFTFGNNFTDEDYIIKYNGKDISAKKVDCDLNDIVEMIHESESESDESKKPTYVINKAKKEKKEKINICNFNKLKNLTVKEFFDKISTCKLRIEFFDKEKLGLNYTEELKSQNNFRFYFKHITHKKLENDEKYKKYFDDFKNFLLTSHENTKIENLLKSGILIDYVNKYNRENEIDNKDVEDIKNNLDDGDDGDNVENLKNDTANNNSDKLLNLKNKKECNINDFNCYSKLTISDFFKKYSVETNLDFNVDSPFLGKFNNFKKNLDEYGKDLKYFLTLNYNNLNIYEIIKKYNFEDIVEKNIIDYIFNNYNNIYDKNYNLQNLFTNYKNTLNLNNNFYNEVKIFNLFTLKYFDGLTLNEIYNNYQNEYKIIDGIFGQEEKLRNFLYLSYLIIVYNEKYNDHYQNFINH